MILLWNICLIFIILAYKVELMSSMKQIDGYKIYMNQQLGKGSFGAVYVGVSDTTG